MISLFGNIKKFPRKGIFLYVLLFSLLIKFKMYLSNYQGTVRFCKYLIKLTPIFKVSSQELQDLNYQLSSSFVSFSNCLIRSLTLYAVFKKTFPSLGIRFGVSSPDDLQVHAWLENEGEIIDSSLDSFELIYSEN